MRRLQEAGTPLEVEEALLVGQTPLRQAAAAWRPMSNRAVDTFIALPGEASATAGLVQVRGRLGVPEADFTFIAPSLDSANGAAHTWARLIGDACQHMAARGIERLYVAISEDDQVALQIFRGCGFAPYTTDVLFELPSPASDGHDTAGKSAGQGAAGKSAGQDTAGKHDGQGSARKSDGHAGPTEPDRRTESTEPDQPVMSIALEADTERAVRQLVHDLLPESVRRSHRTLGGDWMSYPLGGHEPGPALARAWIDERGTVVGAWRAVAGRSASWLQVVTRPGSDVTAAVRSALAELAADARFARLPVWSSARGYETALNMALRECGYEPRVRRFRLVKHTTANVMAPAWESGALAERGLDPATSSSVKLASADDRAPGSAGEMHGNVEALPKLNTHETAVESGIG